MILGHQKQLAYLKKLTDSDKIPHAMIFSGQEKLGKKTLAIGWSSEILKEDLFKKSHPDFILVEPIEKEIQIAQIREIGRKLSLKPFVSSFKIVVIDNAHLMNWQAQNSFLKTLEEPKGKALLILVTNHPESLFSTILSRTQNIKFYPVKEAKIASFLESKGVLKEKAEKIANLSMGSPGAAIDLAFLPEKFEDYENRTKEIEKLISSDLALRFKYAKSLSEKSDLKEILHIWLFYFRRALIGKLNQENSQGKREKDYPLPKLKNIIKKIQETNFLLSSTNVNPKLALEILMLEF